MPHLTILSGNTDAVVPDHAPEAIRPSENENTEPSAATNEKKSDWKSTASATAKLILRGVRDSSDAFGPLKSVAGGLCFILENCEVRSSSTYRVAALTPIPAHEGERGNDRVLGTPGQSSFRTALQTRFRRRSQGTREAKEIGRVSLHSNSKFKNRVSRLGIRRKLEGVYQALARLGEQGKAKGFFNNVGNADKLSGMVEDIRDAMLDYQVCALNNPFLPCLKLLLDIDATRRVRQKPPPRRESCFMTFRSQGLTGG